MPNYGAHSLEQRKTLHPDLMKVCDEVIKIADYQLVEGFRGKTAQNIAYAKGNSKKMWPNSNHNHWPSTAVDVMPWPIDWSENPRALERIVYLKGIFWAVGYRLGIRLRDGLDWNRNLDMRDEVGLHDYPHVELFMPRILTPDELAGYPPMPG